jgi:hypothetical protein
MNEFLAQNEVIVHSNAVAAGTSDIEPAAGIDTSGCKSVTFLIQFGAIVSGAATTVKAQQSTEVDGAVDTFADLIGSGQTVADTDDNKCFVVEVQKPVERYVRAVVTRATQNSTVEAIIAIKHYTRTQSPTQGSTVGGSELHTSPVEGTA